MDMNRILASVLLMAAGSGGILSAQPVITYTGSPVKPGQTATVTATLSGGGGMAALQMFFSVPAGTTIIPTPGAVVVTLSKTLTCALTGTGGTNYGCVIAGGANVMTDGVLAVFTIQVPASATQFNLTLTNLLGATPFASAVTVTGGSPLVVLLSPCDANGDGVTNLLDVSNVVDQITGVIQPATTDLNGDGKTDVVDLQRVVNAIGGICRTGA